MWLTLGHTATVFKGLFVSALRLVRVAAHELINDLLCIPRTMVLMPVLYPQFIQPLVFLQTATRPHLPFSLLYSVLVHVQPRIHSLEA